jgi:hypothetical protein
MARVIHTTGYLTNEQITSLYELAEKMDVGLQLWQDTPAPDRSSFQWAVTGSYLKVRRFMPHLKALGEPKS